jgi:hypothetical protein
MQVSVDFVLQNHTHPPSLQYYEFHQMALQILPGTPGGRWRRTESQLKSC